MDFSQIKGSSGSLVEKNSAVSDKAEQRKPFKFAIPTLEMVEERKKKMQGPLLVTPSVASEPPARSLKIGGSTSTCSKSLDSNVRTSTSPVVGSGNNSKSSFASTFSFVTKTPFYLGPELELQNAEKALLEAQQQEETSMHFRSNSSSSAMAAAAGAPRSTTTISSLPAKPTRKIDARTLLVSRRQQMNPVLGSIHNVPWELSDCLPDFVFGPASCGLYLSLRYHQINPKYILGRMEELRSGFSLKVLVCYVDTEQSQSSLLEIHKASLVNSWTLICAWSLAEAARYIETYKAYESKQADSIQERPQTDFFARATDILTTVKPLNKNNAASLLSTFHSFAGIMSADMERIALCPGLGAKKIKRLEATFHEPFKRSKQAVSGRGASKASSQKPLDDHSDSGD